MVHGGMGSCACDRNESTVSYRRCIGSTALETCPTPEHNHRTHATHSSEFEQVQQHGHPASTDVKCRPVRNLSCRLSVIPNLAK